MKLKTAEGTKLFVTKYYNADKKSPFKGDFFVSIILEYVTLLTAYSYQI